MEQAVLIKMDGNNPNVKFVGNVKEAESMFFRIIANSEEPAQRKENDYGIEFEVIESVLVEDDNKSKKMKPVKMPVRYILQKKYD